MAIEPRTDDHLIVNVDIAPTIASIASVPHPATEGMSMEPLLANPDAPWRTDFLIEHMEGSNPVPSYCGVRTETQKYVRYATGERELYDLSEDPDEMVNLVDDPARSNDVATLDARLDDLCDPPPPGMDEQGGTPAAVALVGVAGASGSAAYLSRRRRRSSR
jgi:arylsulfatase A-like enzyme